MKIILGSKTLGKTGLATVKAKYPEIPVVTIEEDRGSGKSRRVMFNEKAMELLGLEDKASQNLVFGTVTFDEEGNRTVLVVNADTIADTSDVTTYKTSKNKVVIDDETKERNKVISSVKLAKEINEFLEIDTGISHEYKLVPFDVEDAGSDIYRFAKISEENEDSMSLNEDIISNEVNTDDIKVEVEAVQPEPAL